MFEYDSAGVKLDDRLPLPPGKYHQVIVSVEEKLSKNGDNQVEVNSVVDQPGYPAKKMRNWVTFLPPDKSGAGMAIHFLKTIGEPWEGKFTVTPNNWVGKRFLSVVGTRTSSQGREFNDILDVMPVEDGIPFKTPDATVPF